MDYRVISADSHFNEPPGTFVERVPAKLVDHAPRIVPTADGGEGWQFGDAPAHSFGLATASSFGSYENYRPTGLSFAQVMKGSWDPKAHLEDMATDGVDASVLYPGVGLNVYNLKDAELRIACMRAWNDWAADFCAFDRQRLIAPPLLPTEEETIEPALEELRRNVEQYRVRTAQIPIFPWRRYSDPFYDPLWGLAQEMDIPLAFHRGLQRPFAFGSPSGDGVTGQQGPWMSNQVMRDFSYTMPVGDLIFGAVFDRFPNLTIVSAEGRTGWLAHFVQRADESFRRHRHWTGQKLERLPSEYVKQNLYSTFIEDRIGVLLRDWIGTDNQMWSSDYPHSDSTWPHSGEAIEAQLEGVAEEDRRKILAGNAVRLYKLD